MGEVSIHNDRWLVLGDRVHGRPHITKESALSYAERKSRQNPGSTYYVVPVIAVRASRDNIDEVSHG